MKEIFKVLTIFMVFSASSVGMYFLLNYTKDKVTNENIAGIVDYSLYPSVINIAPNTAVVGTLYRFDISIVDTDTPIEEIVVQKVEGPSWIEVFERKFFGTPKLTDIGIHKVVYSVSDGQHTIFQTYYIVVTE